MISFRCPSVVCKHQKKVPKSLVPEAIQDHLFLQTGQQKMWHLFRKVFRHSEHLNCVHISTYPTRAHSNIPAQWCKIFETSLLFFIKTHLVVNFVFLPRKAVDVFAISSLHTFIVSIVHAVARSFKLKYCQVFLLAFTMFCDCFFRREALCVYLGRLPVEVCSFRRTDPSLQETHGAEAVQVSGVRPCLLPLRPPLSAHEAPLTR